MMQAALERKQQEKEQKLRDYLQRVREEQGEIIRKRQKDRSNRQSMIEMHLQERERSLTNKKTEIIQH
jgi:hypothetical protein